VREEFDAFLQVRRIVPVTHDVTSFVFEAPQEWTGRFDAGQHLILMLEIDGAPVERCYTISSPPTRSGTLTITTKRQTDGVVSPWMHDHLQVGERVRARGPFGDFTLQSAEPQVPADSPMKYLFLSAGSGITPSMSMTRALADSGSDADVAFVHSARTPTDIIFRQELDAICESGLDIRVAHVCEADAVGDRWHGARGRLGLDLMNWLVPDVLEREVFLCGPPGYMAGTTELLDALGVDPDRVHRESFLVGESGQLFAADDVEVEETTGMHVELRASGRVVTIAAGSTVLEAVIAGGVMLRSSCRQGMCGTCKLTLVEGEVDMRHQGGIRPREIAQGSFLPCCSRPLTDLVIDA